MEKLGELFKFFKLTPRVFDPLMEEPRAVLASVDVDVDGILPMRPATRFSAHGTSSNGNGARAVSNAIYLDGVDITNSEDGTGQGITTGLNPQAS